MRFDETHLGIIDGLSLGASVGSGVQGVLAKHAKFGGQTAYKQEARFEITNKTMALM